MVDAIVFPLLEQLISISLEEAREQMKLVVGIDNEVAKLKHNFLAIQAVLVDAEQRQFKEETVRLWLDQLKDVSYYMGDVLDEWNTARLKLRIEGVDALVPRRKVCSFLPAASCFGFSQSFQRRDIAVKIKAINGKLDDIAKQKDMYNFNVIRSTENSERIQSTSLIDVSEIRGRDEEKSSLKSKLLCESSEEIINDIQIITIVGMGGIGKTTLAQFAYNDSDVFEYFDKRMWVCVSDPFDELRIAKAIIEALEGFVPTFGELNSLLESIQASLAGKKFLLILDDMWTDDYSKWEPFHYCLKNGVRGSKILITTRKETVARMMESIHVISIKELSEQECWSLFKRFAFFGRPLSNCEQLEEIGKKITGRCKGLPLAAKTIGSLLRFKRTREEWESILDSELWQLEEFEKGLLAPLLLSYNDLPPMIKRCFQYCSVYPKDSYLERDELIKLWMAQDYIMPEGNKEWEIIGEEYFDYLATRSFFQEFFKDNEGVVVRCKMHDIVHDFALFLTKNECIAIEVDDDEEPLSLINTYQEKLRHSMLVLGYEASFPISIFKAKNLRSLFINNTLIQVSLPHVLQSLFDQLKSLRALRIATLMNTWDVNSTNKILKGIEKLIHLRYLRLVGLGTEELPETCCELLNLQVLEIEQCSSLKRLPLGMGKLVNLRHLTYDDSCLEFIPKGIQRLTNLRTLSEFVVVRGGSKYGSIACNLEGLRYLNHLRGSFKIRGLGNVRNFDEPKIANLERKKKLVRLEFDMEEGGREEINKENEANHLAICEALRPPTNLQELEMHHYKGKTAFPSWLISLNKLKKLILSFCTECEILPPLGKLPSLEILKIFGMFRLKRVGNEFLGIEISDHIHATSSSSTSSVIAFPKLKNLSLMGLNEWEEWEFANQGVTIMPQLNYLHISNCSKLKMLPNQLLWSKTLVELKIDDCPILQERFIKIDEQYVQGGPRRIQ